MPQSFDLRAISENAFAGTSLWILPGAEEAYEMGNRALRAGFLASAKQIFLALCSRETDHPELLLALAETELAMGNAGAALRFLEGFPAHLKAVGRIQVQMADCALRQGRIGKALRLGFSSLESSPTDPRCRFLSARLSWLGGQEYEAELDFLSLAGTPETGDRACAWAVLCGWRRGEMEDVSDLLANLRRDDVVCEGLREFGARALGVDWEPNQLVEPSVRRSSAVEWEAFYRRPAAVCRSLVADGIDPGLN
jgi:hypothetical protein